STPPQKLRLTSENRTSPFARPGTRLFPSICCATISLLRTPRCESCQQTTTRLPRAVLVANASEYPRHGSLICQLAPNFDSPWGIRLAKRSRLKAKFAMTRRLAVIVHQMRIDVRRLTGPARAPRERPKWTFCRDGGDGEIALAPAMASKRATARHTL